MVDLDIIEQKPVSMVDLFHKLDSIKTGGKELNFRAEKVHAYLADFANVKKEDMEAIHARLTALEIQRLRDKHIIKIIDVMPQDADSLKAIFAGEVSLKQEEVDKILEAIKG
jgi:DNA-directed RNA polymerase subunit F